MPTAERAIDLGSRRAARHASELGDEIRERRLLLGQSQELVAANCHLSRGRYRRLEMGTAPNATVRELDTIASVLGLSLSIRMYPAGQPVRDAAHAGRLGAFVANVRPPLWWRAEVGLPARPDRMELRAWDLMLFGHDARTAIELEMRLRDVQEVRRRHDLKRRDDPTESFLMLVADTRANRNVLAEFAGLFADLPRLRPSSVRAALQAGGHPPTELLLI